MVLTGSVLVDTDGAQYDDEIGVWTPMEYADHLADCWNTIGKNTDREIGLNSSLSRMVRYVNTFMYWPQSNLESRRYVAAQNCSYVPWAGSRGDEQ